MTSVVRTSLYSPSQLPGIGISAVTSDGRTAPAHPFETQVMPMAGRPTGVDAQRRKGRFLTLMAEGVDPVEARKEAGIAADRALRIVTDSSFQDIVRALRDELAA